MKNKIKYKVKELEIHKDERGWLVELLKADELEKSVKQLHIASIRPGGVRGNHYHSKRMEWFFLVSGKAVLTLEDIKTKKRASFNLSETKPQVITIYPDTSHAIKNTGRRTAYLVSAQDDIFNPKDSDRFPYKIIKP